MKNLIIHIGCIVGLAGVATGGYMTASTHTLGNGILLLAMSGLVVALLVSLAGEPVRSDSYGNTDGRPTSLGRLVQYLHALGEGTSASAPCYVARPGGFYPVGTVFTAKLDGQKAVIIEEGNHVAAD